MEFEDLQAIWDTQSDRPVFAINDSRLAVGLYQQREKSRRRLFWLMFAPMYAIALGMLVGTMLLFGAFLWKSIHIKKIARDFPMSGWDYMAFAVATGSLLAVVTIMYSVRKKHERMQNVFAPSLREELERGLAQLDFEERLSSTPWLLKIIGLMYVGVVLFSWETGRLNGEPMPWNSMLLIVPCLLGGLWPTFYASKTAEKEKLKLLPRRRALEAMRAALEEDSL